MKSRNKDAGEPPTRLWCMWAEPTKIKVPTTNVSQLYCFIRMNLGCKTQTDKPPQCRTAEELNTAAPTWLHLISSIYITSCQVPNEKASRRSAAEGFGRNDIQTTSAYKGCCRDCTRSPYQTEVVGPSELVLEPPTRFSNLLSAACRPDKSICSSRRAKGRMHFLRGQTCSRGPDVHQETLTESLTGFCERLWVCNTDICIEELLTLIISRNMKDVHR